MKKGEFDPRSFLSVGLGGLFALVSVLLIHNELWWFSAASLILTVVVWLYEEFEGSKSISLVFLVSGLIEIMFFSYFLYGSVFIVMGLLAFLIPTFEKR